MVETLIPTKTKTLVDEVIKGILEKKGLSIHCLDLAKIKSTVCDYFIVCHGTSNTHVNAIADSVEDQVKTTTGQRPFRKEGVPNAEWVLIDYLDVVVHVFQEDIRQYYQLEELWADAPLTMVDETTEQIIR